MYFLASFQGLDPSLSTSMALVTTKSPEKMATPTPLASSSSSSSYSARRLKRLLEEKQDPTCAAATSQFLLPAEQRHVTGRKDGIGVFSVWWPSIGFQISNEQSVINILVNDN